MPGQVYDELGAWPSVRFKSTADAVDLDGALDPSRGSELYINVSDKLSGVSQTDRF